MLIYSNTIGLTLDNPIDFAFSPRLINFKNTINNVHKIKAENVNNITKQKLQRAVIKAKITTFANSSLFHRHSL